MFTGIIEKLGRFKSLMKLNQQTQRLKLSVDQQWNDLSIGESISVDGSCLSLVEYDDKYLSMDLSPETLDKTLFITKKTGDFLNLERALKFSDRLGGHIVSGHVEGIAEVIDIQSQITCRMMTFKFNHSFRKYMIEKGSVCLNGVSLTIFDLTRETFKVALIPITLQETALGSLQQGANLHLEVDMIAKYVESIQAHSN